VIKADVSDLSQMSRVFDNITETGSPLCGVIHAAGILDDGILLRQNADRLCQVLKPKVEGSWSLHLLTRSLSLDFFVLFSSVSSVFGAPGQGAYAAANAFLDALSQERRREGLPSLSINWGPWDGAGMASPEVRVHLSRTGVRVLPSNEASVVLSHLLGMNLAQVTVAKVDWNVFRPVYEAKAHRRLFEEILVQAEGSAPVGKPTFVRDLEESPPEQRRAMLIAHVQQAVTTVMRIDADRRIDTRKGFFDIGMDSLMAVELAQHLQVSLGRPVSPASVFDHPTVESLADHILGIVDLGSIRRRPLSSTTLDVESDAMRLEEILKLSDAEAESLLRERLRALESDLR